MSPPDPSTIAPAAKASLRRLETEPVRSDAPVAGGEHTRSRFGRSDAKIGFHTSEATRIISLLLRCRTSLRMEKRAGEALRPVFGDEMGGAGTGTASLGTNDRLRKKPRQHHTFQTMSRFMRHNALPPPKPIRKPCFHALYTLTSPTLSRTRPRNRKRFPSSGFSLRNASPRHRQDGCRTLSDHPLRTALRCRRTGRSGRCAVRYPVVGKHRCGAHAIRPTRRACAYSSSRSRPR